MLPWSPSTILLPKRLFENLNSPALNGDIQDFRPLKSHFELFIKQKNVHLRSSPVKFLNYLTVSKAFRMI